jgi:C-terminal processing protease CtpA/Prc
MGTFQSSRLRIPNQIAVLSALLLGLVTGAAANPRGWLGIYDYDLDPAMQAALGLPHGIMVKEVVGGSPAEKAGLQVGDVLVAMDSEDLLTTEDLSEYVGNRPGQNVRLRYVRQGKACSTEVMLGTREHQLELTVDNLPPIGEMTQQIRPMMRNAMDAYMAEIRALRQQIDELKKDIEKLRKDLKKNEKK